MGMIRGAQDTIEVIADAKITMDLGKISSFKFKVTFRRRDYDDAKEIIRRINDPESDMDDAAVVREDIQGWRDFPGDGGDVDFNDENLSICLSHPEYRLALFKAWGAAQLGRVMANAKN
jgi:hypothetical protein